MEKQYKKLEKKHNELQKEIDVLRGMLEGKVDFEFDIAEPAGDGYCIIHNDEAEVAPMASCLKVIKKKGILTYNDFIDLSI